MVTDRARVVDLLAAHGVIAVLRTPDAESALHAVDALVAGGVTGIEITYSTPGAAEVISEVVRRHGEDVLVGAGTVRTLAQVDESLDAGAAFLVSPGNDPAVTAAMVAGDAAAMVGALTPTEVVAADTAGAHVVKLFPAALGGPSYLRALRGPLPDIPLMPTGGVSAANVADWVAAGAVAVGAGGELCPGAAVRAGRWDEVRQAAAAFSVARAATRQVA